MNNNIIICLIIILIIFFIWKRKNEPFYALNGQYHDSPYYRKQFAYPSYQDKYLQTFAYYQYDPVYKNQYHTHMVDGLVHPHHHGYIHHSNCGCNTCGHKKGCGYNKVYAIDMHPTKIYTHLHDNCGCNTCQAPKIVYKKINPKIVHTKSHKTLLRTFPKYTGKSKWYWHGVLGKKKIDQ